ncbi:uncharacterized protein LOC113505707 [Trichoplusia ni]|uniref:Uncharacterized protein LOC113505707 n=1 Tax=Trichoplusia ni TaxID=7111 RepID=A0A7E5WU02_TRINI|nr:uncharacterized protein LOC113505707 [Trichoplusia ni]
MNQCCFICNNRTGLSLRNATSLFGEHNILTSGKRISEVLGEIVGKAVEDNKVHSNILCKKCHKSCSDYDSMQVKLQAIKTELLTQFKLSLQSHNLTYEDYEKNVQNSPPKPKPAVGKKFVLPASKLQPIPPDLLLKVGKLATLSKNNLLVPQIKPISASTLNLKVTVGSSVLTQTIKTSTAKPADKQTNADTNILTTLTNSLKEDMGITTSQNNMTQKSSILSFNVDSLPKDFLSGSLTKIDFKNEEEKVENNDEHNMEIDEDCLSVMPVSKTENGNIVLQVEDMQVNFVSQPESSTEVSEYLNVGLPSLSTADDEDVTDTQNYILGKLQIMNGDDDDDDGHTIVVDSENGSILRMMSGQKFIYEGGEISLVMPDEDSQQDGDQLENGDSQDSNDESQIELQVSGDEETANAIIAAAQEQGGAFIKVESGEMFRVKSVSSAPRPPLRVVAREAGRYRCLLCDRNDASSPTLGDAETMMRHLKSVHDARIYICQFCGEIMRRRTDYTTHIASHAAGRAAGGAGARAAPHRCATCGKCYSSRALLYLARGWAGGGRGRRAGRPAPLRDVRQYPTPLPSLARGWAGGGRGRRAGRPAPLRDVRQVLQQPRAAVAPASMLYSTQPLSPASHAAGRAAGGAGARAAPHRCATCGKCYSSRALLAEHANVHSGARPHVCHVCRKAFASKYTHQAHLKTHALRPRPYKCSQCGKSFLTQQNLNQHEKTHSGIKDFVCNICNKAFSTQHNLEVHGVVHSGNKAFACTACGKAFARRAELRDHMRIHTGERPFSCETCGARFTQRSNLHSHRRATHMDDKRYACTQCPKRFKRRRLLEYHIKASHTGERPLKCEFCHSSFVYPEHYKKHIRIHSGERPYVCEICGKSFNSRDNRNTHRFVHSDKKPYECVACGAGYMRKQLLYAHMNSSGHLAESIVVNQPRVIKVSENSVAQPEIQYVEAKPSNFDSIFEASELENSVKSVVKSETETAIEGTKLYITEDKKIILQDEKTTLNLIQDSEDPTLLTIHNIDRTDGTILEAVDADQLGDQAEIVANDENGGMVRLIQIKLPDGNNGWVALNR